MGSNRQDISSIYGNRVRVRACGITIHQNKVLLVRHRGLGENGELWSFPGGGSLFDEDLRSALKREYKEETGLDISPGRQLFVYEFIEPPLHAVEIYFEAEISGGELLTGTDPEVASDEQHLVETKFVTFEELSVIKPAMKHEILRHVHSAEALLNLSGYFKF